MIDEIGQWKQFLQGDERSLAEIFLYHHDDLFRYGLKLARDQDMVKDCIQDLFLKLWKNRGNLQVVRAVKPYLFRSLRNHLIDSLELQKQYRVQSLNAETADQFDVKYSQEDFLASGDGTDENRHLVIAALNKLAPRQREAVYLRFFEHLDFETISRVMDMNVQSVRNTLHRGMQAMRKSFGVLAMFFFG